LRSTQGTIDQRVQSGGIDTSGAGIVAKTISNIGQQGADLANKFLLQQKVDQAENFSRAWKDDKSLARQEVARNFQSEMDAKTGLLKDGTSYLDSMKKWEDDFDEGVKGGSPTDMASQAYSRKDASAKQQSLMAAELFQARELKVTTIADTNKAISTGSKELLGVDAKLLESTGGSLKSMAEGKSSDLRSNVTSGVARGIYTDNEARGIYENGSASFANSFFESSIKFNNQVKNAIRELDAPVLFEDEEFAGEAKKVLSGVLGVPESDIDKMKVTADGDILIRRKGVEPKITGFDPESGQTFVVADEQIINFDKPIDITGVVPETEKLSRFITPADKKRHMLDILRKMDANKKVSNKKLDSDISNAKAAFSDTTSDKMRYRPGVAGHADSQVLEGLFARIDNSGRDETTKNNQKEALAIAVVQGEVNDSNVWANNSTALNRIDSLVGSTEKVLESLGAGAIAKDPLFAKRAGRAAKSTLAAHEMQRARASMKSEYTYANDPQADREFNNFLQLEANGDIAGARSALGRAEQIVSSRQDQLGVPKFMQTPYKSSYLSQLSSTMNEQLKPESGFIGKTQLAEKLQDLRSIHQEKYYGLITEMRGKGGLNPGVAETAMFPQTAEGLKAQALGLDVISNYNTIKKNFSDISPDSSEATVRRMSRSKLAPYLKSLKAKTNTSEFEKQANNYVTMVAGRAMMLGGGRDAIDQASKELFTANFHSFDQGSNAGVFYKSELQRSGVSEDIADGSMRYFSDGDNLFKQFPDVKIDFSRYIPDLVTLGKSKQEIKNTFFEFLNKGNVQIAPIPDGDRLIFRIKDKNGQWSEPVMDTDKRILELPLESLKGIPGVVDESKGFFGRFF